MVLEREDEGSLKGGFSREDEGRSGLKMKEA